MRPTIIMAAMWTWSAEATAAAAGARAGWLRPVGAGAGAPGLPTPTCLVYSRRGTPLHLTRATLADTVRRAVAAAGRAVAVAGDEEEAADVLPPVGVLLQADTLLTSAYATAPPTAVPSAQRGNGARWLGLHGAFLLATQRDPLLALEDVGAGDTHGVLVADRGRVRVTPSEYMRAAARLGDTIAVTALADAVPATATPKRQRRALDRSLVFLDACLAGSAAALSDPQPTAATTTPVWAVVLGGSDPAMRAEAAREVAARRGVAGYVLEGFGTGEPPTTVAPALAAAMGALPPQLPRFVPGLATPEELLTAVAAGVDVVEGTYAVRVAEEGGALTLAWPSTPAARYVSLWDSAYATDCRPLVEGCTCYACTNHSRAYLAHLLATHELLAPVLLTWSVDVHLPRTTAYPHKDMSVYTRTKAYAVRHTHMYTQ
jgi:queuine/archaeosine tRNA-ribosyltransferase